MSEHKRCPFCGKIPTGQHLDYGKGPEEDDLWSVVCYTCWTQGPASGSPDAAWTAWDTRHPYENMEVEEPTYKKGR